MVSLDNYKKHRNYLICIDSDGCVMDTMNIKHKKCFVPEVVREWELFELSDTVMSIWCRINLYSMTRGINRFKALYMTLSEIDKFHHIEDLHSFKMWIDENDTLSNATLEKVSRESICLTHVLSWSLRVNEAISCLTNEEKKPFQGAKDAVHMAHKNADIAVVSSANIYAVKTEWESHNILNDVDILCAQDTGSKEYVIGTMLEQGYAPERVIMIGDAPGDLKAADTNGIRFYPILVENEKKSWEEFKDTILPLFISGNYSKEYQTKKVNEFVDNLNQLSQLHSMTDQKIYY